MAIFLKILGSFSLPRIYPSALSFDPRVGLLSMPRHTLEYDLRAPSSLSSFGKWTRCQGYWEGGTDWLSHPSLHVLKKRLAPERARDWFTATQQGVKIRA